MPQHVDLFVDRRGLGDVGVRDRHIGLGLVVVVIGDEIFDRVVRKELAQLIAELGCQGLVVGQHQRRTAGALNHIGDRKGFTRARGTQERLIALTPLDTLHQGVDRRRLIAVGAVGGFEAEIHRLRTGAATLGSSDLHRVQSGQGITQTAHHRHHGQLIAEAVNSRTHTHTSCTSRLSQGQGDR